MTETTVLRDFECFVAEIRPRLTRSLTGHLPIDLVPDAVAEALGYAWERWPTVRSHPNPGGLLFRVAQSRVRRRLSGVLPGPDPQSLPHVEPRLGMVMRSLPAQQRSAVWLVHACGWSYAEAAEAMGISSSAVGTHVARGLVRIRQQLGVK